MTDPGFAHWLRGEQPPDVPLIPWKARPLACKLGMHAGRGPLDMSRWRCTICGVTGSSNS